MKKSKKIMSLFLTLAMVFTMIPGLAFADETSGPAFNISSTSGKAGDEVTVTVDIENNPGIMAMNFAIDYDTDRLEMVSITGEGMGGGVWTVGTKVLWDNGANSTYNGQIMTLEFKIKEDALPGDAVVTIKKFLAANLDGKEVVFNINPGKVTVQAAEVTGIAVTTPPEKTDYKAFETFDPAGIVVTATYDNNKTAPVTGYTVTYPNGEPSFRVGDEKVILTYEGKTTEQPVTVSKATIATTGFGWNYTEAFTYDSTEKSVQLTNVPKGVSVTSYENNTKTAAGKYAAKAILSQEDTINYENVTIGDLEWVINPAEVIITPDAVQKVYGADEPELTYTTNLSDALKIDFEEAVNGALTRAEGEFVGKYEISKGTLEAGTNFSLAVAEKVYLTIVPAEQNLTVPTEPVPVKIGQVINLADKVYGYEDGSEITYRIAEGTGLATITGTELKAGMTPGTVKIEVSASGVDKGGSADVEYSAAKEIFEVSIEDKEPVDITGVTEAPGLVYNGQPQAGYVLEEGKDKPYDKNGKYTGGFEVIYNTEDGKAPTEAGKYTVTFKVPESNATYTGSETLSFEINKKQLEVPAAANDELIYSAEEQTMQLDEKFDADIMNVSGNKGTDAKKYTAEVTLKDTKNYKWANTEKEKVTVEWSIVPKTVVITPVAAEKVYGAKDPVFDYTTDLTTNALKEAFNKAKTGSLAREAGEYAGEYAIGIGNVAAGENFTVVLNASVVNFIIKAAAQTITVPAEAVKLMINKSVDLNTLVQSDAGRDAAFTFTIEGEGAVLGQDGCTLTANTDKGTITVTVSAGEVNVDKEGAAEYLPTEAKTFKVELIEKNSVTITGVNAATGLVYNGQPQQGYTGTPKNAQGYTENYVITYSSGEKPTNAGDYTVTISVPEDNADFKGSVTIPFTIAKKPVAVPTVNGTYTYSAAEQTVALAIADEDAITISGVQSATNKGNYEVTAALKNANYKWDDDTTEAKTIPWSIAAKAVTVTPDAVSKVYGEADPELTYKTNLSGALAEAFQATGTLSREAGTYVGTYPISGTITAGDNFVVTVAEGVNFTITPAVQTIAVKEAELHVKINQNINFAGNTESDADGAELVYAIKSGSDLATLSGTILTAGAEPGTVVISVNSAAVNADNAGDAEYNAAEEKTFNVVIDAKDPVTITGVNEVEGLVYDGTAKVGYTGAPKDIAEKYDGTFEVSYEGRDGTVYTSNDAPTNAGKYAVIFKVPAGNPDYTGTKEVQFEIAKAKVTAPADPQFITAYSGTAINFSFNDDFDAATMTKAGTEEATEAGTYTVTVALKDNANYVWSDNTAEDKPYTWTIEPRGLEIPETAETSFTYNGNVQTLEFTGLDETTMTVSGNTATAAGKYTATVELKDTKNYKWLDMTNTAKTFAWEIKAATVVKPALSGEYTYTAEAQTVTVTGFDANTMTVSGNTATDAGTHTATFALADKANYTWADGSTADINLTWTIAKKAVTVTPDAAEKTYGEDDPALTYTTDLYGALAAAFNAAKTGALERTAGEYAGEYAISKGTVAAGGNFDVTVAEGVKFTIKAAAQNVTVPAEATPLKIGKTIDLTTLVSSNAGDKAVFVFEASGVGATLTGSILKADINEGTITITVNSDAVSVGGDAAAEYNAAEAKTFTINLTDKTVVTITGTAKAEGLKYTGQPQAGYTGTPANAEGFTKTYEVVYTGTGYGPTATPPTEVGTYTVVIKVPDNDTDFAGNVSYTFEIAKAELAVPAVSGTLTYNTAEQTVVLNGFDAEKMAVTGNAATNAGSYTATVTLKDEAKANYKWAETENDAVTVEWSIAKATVTGTVKTKAITAKDKTLADVGLEKGTITVAGTLAWNLDEATVVTQGTEYTWTFTPEDTANYEVLTGKVIPWPNPTPPSGGGFVPLPPKQDEPVTNQSGTTTTAPSTNADMFESTTMKGNETTTKVDQTVADKIVENAVANKSEEVVIDATYHTKSSNQSTKSAAVELPTETIAQIAEKTEAAVTIKTDVAEIKLDTEALAAVAEQAEGKSVSVVAEKVKADAKEVRIELKVVCSEGNVISDFKGGSISVTVEAPKGKKDVVCVYIDEQGHWHTVPGQLNADGTYTFTTGHFSTYAIVDAEHAADTIAAQKEAVKNVQLKIRSANAKTSKGKKAIKLTISKVTKTGIDFDGYVIYRSTKKTSGFKKIYTTKTGTYFNTSAKKGVKYYYKAKGFVTIDGEKVYTGWSKKAIRTAK